MLLPTSTAITVSGATASESAPKIAAGCRRSAGSTRSARRAFSTLHRAQRSASRSRAPGRAVAGIAADSSSSVRRMSPQSGTATGWNLPRVMRSRSTWIVGTHVAIPVWFENDAPSTSRQSAFAIVAEPIGVPERPSTPHASGWSSGTRPFALNVVMTGASIRSANASTWSRHARAPAPTMMTGRSAAASSAIASPSSACGGVIAVAAIRP